jgi:signal transduction histidine kinase
VKSQSLKIAWNHCDSWAGVLKQVEKNSNDTLNAAVTRGRMPGLVPDLKSDLGKRQLREVSRLLPFLVVFHLCATVATSLLAEAEIPSSVLHAWQFSAVAVASLFTVAIYVAQTQAGIAGRTALLLRALPYLGVLLALVWTVPPLIFSRFIGLDANVVTFGIVLAMLGIGVTTMLRIPATAILYTVVLAAVIAESFYATLQHNQLIAAIVVLLFGAALVSIILLVHVDYIKRHAIEFDLNRQGQIIKLLLNDFERETSDWLWETDRSGKLIYASPRLGDILNRNAESILGEAFLELIGSENQPLEKLLDAQSEITGTIVSFRVAEKKQYWKITGRPLRDDRDRFTGYRGVGRDITHQHDAEIEIRNAKDLAEQASAAKSQFLAVISHELRTPINAIVGFSEILNSSHGESLPSVNRKDYLNTILESAKHLQSLINDVLDATRIERGTLQLTEQDNDAAELVEVAIKICRDQATTGKISIVAHVSEDVIVTGDMTRLKQVILNLLTNAIKFSPEGGVVNIDMQRRNDGALTISVRDAGVGISAADAERVFEPFVQADGSITRRFGGMGLGLSIARRIARMHSGDVTLSGEVGVGTDARLILPAARVRWPKKSQAVSGKVAA